MQRLTVLSRHRHPMHMSSVKTTTVGVLSNQRRPTIQRHYLTRQPPVPIRFRLSTTILQATADELEDEGEETDDDDDLDFILDGEIPDFDDLVLDDAFYKVHSYTTARLLLGVIIPAHAGFQSYTVSSEGKEVNKTTDSKKAPLSIPGLKYLMLQKIGVNKEVLDKYPPWAPEYTDPKGYNVTFEDYLQNRLDIPDYIKADLKNAQYFGPPVLLVAGFRLEELPLIRMTVDELIGDHVKVIPIFGQDVLEMQVEDAVHLPEPDWTKARPENWTRGGTWGSQRTILFGGLSMEEQASVVEIIEESGLPPVCVTIASEQTRHFQLGQLMADAIRLQRDRKNPDAQLWEGDHVIKDVSDLEGFVQNKMMERMETVKNGLENGTAVLDEDPKTGTMRVKMNGLEEELFDAEDISIPLKRPPPTRAARQPTKEVSQPTPSSTGAQTKDFKFRFSRRSFIAKPDAETKKKTENTEVSSNSRSFNDRPLTSEETEIAALTEDLDDPLSDFFAVDDLVSSALGMQPPMRPSKTSEAAFEPKAPENSSGRVYPISSEPEPIEENTKRSTVFSGLVKDPTQFMKENFGYDPDKTETKLDDGGDRPNVETIDVTTVEEQEALEGQFANVGWPRRQDDAATVEDVVQEAIKSGIAPEKLKELIRSVSDASERPTFRKRFRR